MEQFPSFPNYTEDMYNGNEFASKTEGGYDAFYTKYGETIVGVEGIVCSKFCIDKTTTIYICGNSLWIIKSLQNGIYQFCVNCNGMPKGCCYPESKIHKMGIVDAYKTLDKAIANCKLWELVKARALDIIEKEKVLIDNG